MPVIMMAYSDLDRSKGSAPARGLKSQAAASWSEIQPKVDEALRVIERLFEVSGRNILAYSGGKDSRVVAHLLVSRGILKSAVAETSLMWEADGVDNRRFGQELGLRVREYDRLGADWVKRNPHFIFADLKTLARLYQVRQQETIRRHTEAEKWTGVVLGRRSQENFVPKPLYQRKNGIWQCNPIMSWRYEHVWGYLAHHGIDVSPVYSHKIGVIEGASPWPAVSNEHVSEWGYNAFDLVNDYDARVIDWLATWWEPARLYRAHGYSPEIMNHA